MARKTFTASVFALILSVGVFTQNAGAQAATTAPPGPARIGVINIQAAIVNTNEGKREFAALQQKFEPKQTELKGLKDEIDALQKQLAAQQDKLSDDERTNRTRTIAEKQKTLQRDYEDAQNDFQSQQNDAANRIGEKMMAVIDKYARANGITVVLDVSNPQSSPVLWASETVNIGPAIVEAYNAQSTATAPPAATKPAAPGAATRKPTTTPKK